MKRHQIFPAIVALTIVTALGSTGAKAVVLYEAAPAGTLNTPAALSGGSRTAFESFVLSDAATVTSAKWLGTGSLASDIFQVGIYESTSQHPTGGRPVASPLVTLLPSTVDVTVHSQDPATREYEVDFGTSIFLEANTIYWFSVKNLSRDFWFWKGDTGGSFVSRTSSGQDILGQLSPFFTLEGDLGGGEDLGGGGEPPLAMSSPPVSLLLGLGVIALARRRLNRPRTP